MGLLRQGINAVRARIRRGVANDKDAAARHLAHGSRGLMGGQGADILYGYGQGQAADFFRTNQDLLTRLADYEEMDEYGELNAALDLFADDTVQPDTERSRTVWVTCSNRKIENILNDLLWKTLRFDHDAWSLVRTLCKTGNEFEEPLIDETGVVGIQPLPVASMRRIEGPKGDHYGFIQDFKGTIGYTREEFYELLHQRNSGTGVFARPAGGNLTEDEETLDLVIPFERWEIVHFRLGGRNRRSPYGESILEAARPIFRQLKMLEDAALFYRLERSPERLVFYTDVGDMPPPMARAEMNRLRQEYRKRRMIDPVTGKPNLKFDAIAQSENIFVPVRGDKRSSEIEVLNSPSWQSMEDVEFFLKKLFTAVKIPPAYLGREEGVVRSILSNEDVRFARTVMRIQRAVINGLEEVCDLHLMALGVDPDQVDYEVRMTVPSAIFELAQMEVRNARADLVSKLRDVFPLEYLYKDVFHLTDNDIETIFQQRGEDKVRDAAWEATAQLEATKYGPPGMDPTSATGADGGGGGEGGSAPSGGGEEEEDADPRAYLLNSRGVPAARPARRSPPGGPLVTRWRAKHPIPPAPFTEEELRRGGRGARGFGKKLETLLSNDRDLAYSLRELNGLLHELRAVSRRR